MRPFLAIAAIMLLFVCVGNRNALGQATPDDVWVNVRYQADGIEQPAIECYGLIHRADLAAMLGSTGKIAGLLKVTRVARMENGQLYPLSDMALSGSKFGFKNVMYIRADTIVRIVELDDTFVNERLLPLKE